ncbi:MAG TPA: di-trans,poly-cis-decaprenylcistransferase [Acholeplasmataceae bacterium]|nr:di-trans,poly-cis-decaprenylcistransferase [Acholeplasmataceae bacterium]
MEIPNHLAIILDGNGRWAKRRMMPRNYGHYQGAINLFKIANKSYELGVKYLTVFAFSTENWQRPTEEVNYLMEEPLKQLNEHEDKLAEVKFKIIFVGKKNRIPDSMKEVVKRVEAKTKDNTGMVLQIALDYGSKDEIVSAFNKAEKPYTEESIKKHLYVTQDVDLLIRTSGEQRLSNYLLWQSAYAEFIFVKKHWPAFREKDLKKAIKKYSKRNRRFGAL